MENIDSELTIIGHCGQVTDLAFSADGKTLLSASYDQTAILWDVETAAMLRRFRLHQYCGDVAFTPNGKWLVTDFGQVWETSSGRLLRKFRRVQSPFACAPDSRSFAAVDYGSDPPGDILLVDIRTGRTLRRFPTGALPPESIIFSSDGVLIATSRYEELEEDGDAAEPRHITTVSNVNTGKTQTTIIGRRRVHIFGVNWSNGVRLAGVTFDPDTLWNVETGEILVENIEAIRDLFDHPSCVVLTANERLLAFDENRGGVCVWDIDTASVRWRIQAHEASVRTIAFSPDGQTVATAGDDHAIQIRRTADGSLQRLLGQRKSAVKAVAFSPDGQTITAIHKDGRARLWRISPAACERQEAAHYGVLARGAPHSPDTARNLWTVSPSSLPTVADVPDGFQIAALSPDGSRAAFQGPENEMCVWNRNACSLECMLPTAEQGWARPVFSPDNRTLAASVETNDTIQLFDVTTGKLLRSLPVAGFPDCIVSEEAVELLFSPDSRLLAIGHVGFSVTLWNVRTSECKRRLWTYGDSICALSFSPDCGVLAIGTAYEEAFELKGLKRGRKNHRIVGHTDHSRSADFSPDGALLATGSEDGTVKLWEAETGRLLATFMTLPNDEWVIYTPAGDYRGSPEAEKYLMRQQGKDLIPVTRK